MQRNFHALIVLVSVITGSTVGAQTPLHTLAGTAPLERFGAAVVEVGDLNADDAPEIAVATGGGRVDVFDGSTGQRLFFISGANNTDFGHALAAMGDVNGDSVFDFAVAAPAFSDPSLPGEVFVYSGANGALIYSVLGAAPGDRFGFAMAALEITGDRVRDLVVGSPGSDVPVTDAGKVELVEGVTGSILLSAIGSQPTENFGHGIAKIPDIDGDGHRDILVGAPGGNQPPMTIFFGGTGEVQLISGLTFNSLLLLQGFHGEDLFGSAVAPCPDVDGDGLPDIVVGAPGMDDGVGADAGVVLVYGSVSGHLERGFRAREAGERFGEIVVNVGDLNGDGFAEFAVGSPLYGASLSGRVQVIDAVSGQTTAEFFGTTALEGVGKSVGLSLGYGSDRLGEIYIGATGARPVGILSGELRSYSFGRGLYGSLPQGGVGANTGGPFHILRVNGQGGGKRRHHVQVPLGTSFSVTLEQPPNRATPAPFVIYGMVGIPQATNAFAVAGVTGLMLVTPCDAAPNLQPTLFTLADSASGSLCPSLLPATLSPWTGLLPPVFFPLTWTLQGLVEVGPGVVEITNAVLVTIR